jgi:hypothetical protein
MSGQVQVEQDQVHAAALAVVLDRAGEQVEQDLLEPLAVAEDVGGARDVGADHHDAVLVGQGPDQADRLGHDVGQGDRLQRQRQPPGLDGRDVQDLVDQGQQVPGPREDVAQVLALLVGQVVQLQQLGEAEDGLEGRPQLVAHPRQVLALGLVGLLGGELGQAQLLLEGRLLGDVAGDHEQAVGAARIRLCAPRVGQCPSACRTRTRTSALSSWPVSTRR